MSVHFAASARWGRRMAAAIGLALFGASQLANAAGYFSGSHGARAAGRAGAFTVATDDLSAVMLNPGGLARIEGTLLQVSDRLSYNDLTFTRAPTLDWGHPQNGTPPFVEFPAVHNTQPWQVADPLVGLASRLGLRDWAFAVAAFAPPGIARESFPLAGGQRYMMVSRDAIILNYSATAAYRFRDVAGFGVSAQWIHVPKLDYSLVIDGNTFPDQAFPVSSELDMLATIKGSDLFTFNAVVGGWYRPLPFLEVAAAAQVVPTSIKTHSRLSVTPVSSTLTEKTITLSRDLGNHEANDVSLTLPLPLFATVGVRYLGAVASAHPFDVELDLHYESWSRVNHFTLETNGLVATYRGSDIPIGQIRIEKMWRDTVSVHLGGDYVLVPGRVTLRSGVAYESAVSSRPTANVDFVSGQQLVGALGASYFWGPAQFVVAYEYRRQPTFHLSEADGAVYQQTPGSQCMAPYTAAGLCHQQYLGQPAPVANGGQYGAESHTASVEVLYHF